jgi:hypothetical protein
MFWHGNAIPLQISSFKRYVIKPKGFLGTIRGIACALNIPSN